MINSGFFSSSQSKIGNSFVDMEGRGYTDLQRNKNDEIILKSMAESSNKMPMPTMEMAGFKNHLQTLRIDSEELFKSWITSEESHNSNSSSIIHRTPQGMGRMAKELNFVTPVDDENSTNLNQGSIENVIERGVPASNRYMDKAWYHSTQPMTRSRSSDLRRNYATLQNFQTSVSMETTCDVSGSNIINPINEFENQNGFCEAPFGNIRQISSFSNFVEKQNIEDGSLGVYGVQEVLDDMNLDQNRKITYLNLPDTNDNNRVLGSVDGPLANFECFDEGQNIDTTCDQKPREKRVRCESVTSADPVAEGQATKKRRVERSRKMAEAKEKILTPAIPSDMQSIVKHCESLEKEVRSLKLNLAFMNRKDSEQTKQLEELHIQHRELTEEKERLLEEIERILATRRKM